MSAALYVTGCLSLTDISVLVNRWSAAGLPGCYLVIVGDSPWSRVAHAVIDDFGNLVEVPR